MHKHRKALREFLTQARKVEACSEFSIRKESFVSYPLELCIGLQIIFSSMKNSELLVLGGKMGNRFQPGVAEKVKLLLGH